MNEQSGESEQEEVMGEGISESEIRGTGTRMRLMKSWFVAKHVILKVMYAAKYLISVLEQQANAKYKSKH